MAIYPQVIEKLLALGFEEKLKFGIWRKPLSIGMSKSSFKYLINHSKELFLVFLMITKNASKSNPFHKITQDIHIHVVPESHFVKMLQADIETTVSEYWLLTA